MLASAGSVSGILISSAFAVAQAKGVPSKGRRTLTAHSMAWTNHGLCPSSPSPRPEECPLNVGFVWPGVLPESQIIDSWSECVSENPCFREKERVLDMNVHFVWSFSVAELILNKCNRSPPGQRGAGRGRWGFEISCCLWFGTGGGKGKEGSNSPSPLACVRPLSHGVLPYLSPTYFAIMCLCQLGILQAKLSNKQMQNGKIKKHKEIKCSSCTCPLIVSVKAQSLIK